MGSPDASTPRDPNAPNVVRPGNQPPPPIGGGSPVAPPPACAPQPVNLFRNAGFEEGRNVMWSEFSTSGLNVVTTDITLPVMPRAGQMAAWLGGYNATAGEATDYILQDITMPPNGERLQITGYVRISTKEKTGEGAGEWDTLQMSIRSPQGQLYEVLKDASVPCQRNDCTWSNENDTGDWVAFTLNSARSYPGQTVRIEMQATLDAASNTNFYFDELNARFTACQ